MVDDYDWYYQHSWFDRKWFKHKLNRKVMNLIYTIYRSIEEMFLESYLVEFHFYTRPSNNLDEYNKKHNKTYLGDFKCYLPILFKVRDYHELETLVGIINRQLTVEYGCSVIATEISDKMGGDAVIQNKIISATNKLEKHKLGTIDILTFTPKEVSDADEPTYNERTDRFNFRIIKSGPNMLRGNFEYMVMFFKSIPQE